VRALGILATAPIPGQVKRRLAEEVGASTAAEVYWQTGRRVVAAAVGSGYRTIVWYRPAQEAAHIREWLEGLDRVELRPQTSGHLGFRLAAAFARHFGDGADRVVLIGTDCPGVDQRLVTEAFTGLGSADVVLGPTLDGGYYLIGLREPQPALFQDIPWGSTVAFAQTRARAQALGLTLRLLRPLRDVDTAQDARAWGLLKA
jgi:uncharacterized protein